MVESFEGDLVDRGERVALDLDLGDVVFDDGFALAWGAVLQDVGEVAAQAVDRLGAGQRWQVVAELVEFVLAGSELVEFEGQVLDAVAAGPFVEGAVLERSEVAVDGRFRGGDLSGDGVEFCLVAVAAVGA
ncbi:hypothetical protein [Micromonospora sp. KC207]|uniref:hypothetical protein n=1 Tax=Micromonospora sp. KC207 TaxID=2530377 RepID=UPI001FB6ADEE|nr:hypothetical protein [Micromonospora sp. KC207]